MRKLAQKMKKETEVMEENKVEVRKDDKTIRNFEIKAQDIAGELIKIESVKVIHDHEPVLKKTDKLLRARTEQK